MTNGEKMQEMFPEGKTRRCRGGVVFESDGWCHAYDSDWWNAECKEPTTENDSSELAKNSKKLEKDFGESDCISRKTILDELEKWDWQELYLPIHFKQMLDELPSVTPQEPRWIPVSERMPEENRTVIASTKHGVYPEARYTKEDGWEWAYESGADYWEEIGCNVLAWMPLPEPYKAESEEVKTK